jgi:HK97 family phage prohead protease
VDKRQPPEQKTETRHRQFKDKNFGIRSIQSDDGKTTNTMFGAIMYNQPSEIMEDYWGDRFVEEISEGAFNESIQNGVIKSLWCHDTSKVLGSTRSGTLRITIGNDQIDFENDLPNNSWGEDARESVGRGDVDGLSFGMYVQEERWSKIKLQDDTEIYKRSILKAELLEISPTGFPAYPANSVGCRSLKDFINSENLTGKNEVRKRKLMIEIGL